MAAWHTIESLKEQWASAQHLPDALLEELLAVAQYQVLEFAPALADGIADDELPDNYRYGQMLQARALWESQQAKTSADVDVIGNEYQVRVYPLSAVIRGILRPSRGIGGIG